MTCYSAIHRAIMAAAVLAAPLLVDAGRRAEAAPLCLPGAFTAYEMLGSAGCALGALTFSDFRYFSSSDTNVVSAAIAVAVDGTPNNVGLSFLANWTASHQGGGPEFDISFRVTADGALIDDATLGIAANVGGQHGIVQVNAYAIIGDPDPTDPALFVYASSIPVGQGLSGTQLSDHVTFGPVSSLQFLASAFLLAGSEDVSITSIATSFSTQPVLEPASIALLAQGIVGLAMAGRRRRLRN